MRLTRDLESLPGVERASAMMGTPHNRELLREAGLLTAEGERAAATDLILAVIAGKREDAERAQAALAAAGFRTETPPEPWLLKAFDGDVLVDLIFDPQGGPVDDGVFERAEELEVYAMRMRVARLEDVITQKLLALSEQEPDFSGVLELARSLREQVDWDEVRRRTRVSAFARAYFTLLDELEIVSP
jgi:hypothetical protein